MDTRAYRQRLAACFPGLTVRTVTPVLAGWDNVLLEVNGEWMFRFPRRAEVEAQFQKEIRLLRAIGPLLPLPVPQYTYVAPPEAGGLCAGYRKLPGAPLTREAWQSAPQAHLARQLAGFLSALHRIPPAPVLAAGLMPCDPDGWRQEYVALHDEVATKVLPRLDGATRTRAAALWERALGDAQFFAFRPCLVHRDFMSGNILYDAAQGAIGGIIDWGDAAVGDPAIDFAGVLYDLGGDAARAMLAHYTGAADARFRQRSTFYAQVVPFHGLLYALARGDEADFAFQAQDLPRALSAPGLG